MDAVLTVESEEAVRLARELAELTGESINAVVIAALRAMLARQRAARARAEAILSAAAEIRSQLREPLPSSDHGRLYGEDGLPA